MHILITGANGQLGMSLRKIAGEYPSHSFVFTDLPEADITDRSSMALLIDKVIPDVIVNCAAYTAVDRAEGEPEIAESINSGGPSVLASLAKERGAALIHISTDYVFDGTAAKPYRENDPVNPATIYGKTKLAGERAVEASGADAAVIRTAWLYSEFGNNFVKTMLRLACEGRDISVVNDQTGSPTYATDLARAVMAVIGKGIKGYQVYHYSGSGQTTWYGFAKKIFTLAGRTVNVAPVPTSGYPTAATRPPYSVLDTSKIQNAGAAVRPWEESLEECLKIIAG